MPSERGMRAQFLNPYRAPPRVEKVCNIAVRVRLDWWVEGEQVAHATVTGWVGRLVRLHLAEQGVEVWSLADAVRRAT